MPIFHEGQVPAQFLQKMNQFGNLLLGQQIDLQIQMHACFSIRVCRFCAISTTVAVSSAVSAGYRFCR